MLVFGSALALIGTTLSCNKSGDTGDGSAAVVEWRPDVVCPGDAGCETNEGTLMAGAAAVAITPTCFEAWEDLDGNGEYDKYNESYFDCGCDQLCEDDDGYPGADDGEGDGEFQAVWLAGFQNGRPANSVHDDMWARAVVMQSGDTTVALVVLDVVGWFYDEALRIREAVAASGGDVDVVVVQSTHQHEGPDTLGQWGAALGKRGVDDDYIDDVVANAAEAVVTAYNGMETATLELSSIDTAAPFGAKGTRNLVRDSRDPKIIDEMLYTAQFIGASGDTIATLVNWGNHPEALSDENTAITSDYAHYLREGIEQGVFYDSYEVEGVGGVCLYVNAAVGGLMTPLGVTVTDGEGIDFDQSGFEKSEAIGKVLAELALEAMADSVAAEDPTVSVRAATLYIPVQNTAFQAMFLMGVLERDLYNYDPDDLVDEDNQPDLLTEIDLIDVGPLQMLTVPGELFPELAIGGYDGTRLNTEESELIDEDNDNPPDLDQAPDGPYFKDLMGGDFNWIVGLGNDEIGYLVPSYDYKLDEGLPYINQADGDHYEETNSVGPQAVPLIQSMVNDIIDWTP